MNRWQRLATILVVTFSLALLAACDDGPSTADANDTNITNQQFDIYSKGQPIHLYNFSMPRDVMIQIYDATMTAHNTWTVWYALSGEPIDMCPSIGYPIPGGTQLTNPNKENYHGNSGGGNTIVPQGEPNGLFPPSTAAGTWVLCVRGKSTEPTYVEPNVVTYGHPVKIENGRVVDAGGDSSVTVQIRNSQLAPTVVPGATPAPTKKP